ncbi:MAG: sterol desaturase family protein [Paracoccaceae bacterium]|nr:sterol desaturase family protein [Paracoccaceae bacterium]
MSSNEWNHVPDQLPLPVNPLWQWPPRPISVLRWYWSAWFPISISLGIVGLAFLAYHFASPTLEQAKTPGAWMLTVFVRNFILISIIAHGLQILFHGKKAQGLDHKYDPRPFPRKGRVFTFSDQLLDNMFWALASGVTIWSGFEVLLWWAMANGYAGVWLWSDGAFWFIFAFALIPVWESFYFYWIHRLLHTNLMYRFHALHHRNTDVGPWSGLSMHPIEHMFYFGTGLIHFIVPTHPVHMICHLMFYAIYAITTHTGFEGLWIAGRKRLQLGMFHHQMHHRYFEVNYGSLDVPWDKFFGTFHDGTPEGKAMMKERLRTRKR